MHTFFRSKLGSLSHKLGLDSALIFGILTKVWGAFSGIANIVLIGIFLTRPEQGYYYTFSSLLALNVFVEMGLTSVLSNFAAHEFVHLHWGPSGELRGNDPALQRVLALLVGSTSWFIMLGGAFAVLLAPTGALFLLDAAARHQTEVSVPLAAWCGPWLAAVGTATFSLALGPFVAILNGSGDVSNMNRVLLLGRIAGTAIAWISMFAGQGLYAVALVPLGSIISVTYYIVTHRHGLLSQTLSIYRTPGSPRTYRIAMRREIWPMQWRIAISWMAGFLIFQLFNPLLFYYRGPVAAGQFGITLSAANTALGVGVTWFLVKIPDFGRLVATKSWAVLDRTFARSMGGALLSTAGSGLALLSLLAVLAGHNALASRFLPVAASAVLLLAIIMSVAVDGFAIYLRAHKKEPLMAGSVLVGTLQAILSWWAVRRFGAFGIACSFAGIYAFLALPGTWLIWHTKRREWHTEGAAE